MHHRLGGYLVPSVHGCAHYGRVQIALRTATSEAVPIGGRRDRLRAAYEKAGGRPDEIRRQPGRCLPDGERSLRHCP